MKLLKESECAKNYALIKALEESERARIVVQLAAQQRAAAQAAEIDRKVGKHRKWIRPVMHISEHEYWHCRLKYGEAEVHSKEFIKYHTRKHPEQRVKKI